MRAIGSVMAVAVALLAGCFGSTSNTSSQPCISPCGIASETGGAIVLHDCQESTFTIELASKVYPLPAGFTDKPTTGQGQTVFVAMDHCPTATLGNKSLGTVSYGFVAVAVKAPARGQPSGPESLDVETFSDNALLTTALGQGRFPVVNASISVQDNPPTRSASATGDVSYQATITLASTTQGQVLFTDSHHSESTWMRRDRTCQSYGGISGGTVAIQKGELSRAAPSGILAITGTQSKTCDVTLSFNRDSR
jgi:hypothetical protein